MLGTLSKAKFLRFLRFIHSWMGIIVVPWIIIIGATGLYLNHSRMIMSAIEGEPYDESRFVEWPLIEQMDVSHAEEVAAGIWPSEVVLEVQDGTYHKLASFILIKTSGRIIVTKQTGHYFVKTQRTRTTYAPDGDKLHRRIYWGSIFKQFHTDGWLGGTMGTWAADLTSIAMVIFGITGMIMWWIPRANKFRRAFRKMRSG